MRNKRAKLIRKIIWWLNHIQNIFILSFVSLQITITFYTTLKLMTEIITASMPLEKAYLSMLTNLHKAAANQPTKQLKNNSSTIKILFEKYRLTLQILKNLPKGNLPTIKEKTTSQKIPPSAQQIGQGKSKEKSKIAALETAIACLDPNSPKTKSEQKPDLQNRQLIEQIYRIMDMKLAVINACTLLQKHVSQKPKNDNWKQRLEQPLIKLLEQNINLKNQIPTKHNSNENAQNPNNLVTKKLQPSKSTNQKLTSLPSHLDKDRAITKKNNELEQQSIQQPCQTKREDVKDQSVLKDPLQIRQSLEKEQDKVKQHLNDYFNKCQQSIQGLIHNQIKLKSEIDILNQSFSRYRAEKERTVQPPKRQSVTNEQIDTISELKSQLEQLANSLAVVKGQLTLAETQKTALAHQIAGLQKSQTENTFTQSQYEEQLKQKNQTIQKLSKQNLEISTKTKDLQIQLLKAQNSKSKQQDQPPIEQPQKIQYYDAQSWINTSEDTKHVGDLLIKEVQKTNGKPISNSTLLYRYSPSTKLEWSHFVNKPNIIFLIKLATNKLIAVYSLAPFLKPNSTSQPISEQKAFIFQSTLNATNIAVYPLLPGKKINGSYSTNVAFGKSDLRFSIGDTILQGNFGYAGSYFDSKKRKITELFGGAGKVNMLAYQIYSIDFNQQKKTGKSQEKMIASESRVTSKIQSAVQEENQVNKTEINQMNLAHAKQVEELKQYISKQTEEISLKQKEVTDLKERYKNIKEQQFIKNEECSFLKREIQALSIKRGGDRQATQITEQTEDVNPINQQWMHLSIELETIKKRVLPQKEAAITEAKTEIDKLRQSNQHLTSKLVEKQIKQKLIDNNEEKPQQSPKDNATDKQSKESSYLSLKQTISNPKLKLNDSTLHSYQQYQQMAKVHQIEPLFIARIDKFFQNTLLQGKLNYKIRIVKHLQKMRGINFCKAKLVYQYDPFTSNQFHKYIDGTPNLLCVVQTKEGTLMAAYYSGTYTQKQIMSKPSLLICVNKDESYELYKQGSNGQRIFRGMVFDPYFLLFGNAELKIKPKEKYVFSNFGIANSFFNPRGKKTKDFFGESPKVNESEFKALEIYQIFFEQAKEKKALP